MSLFIGRVGAAALVVVTVGLVSWPRAALGWATAEHVRFGQQIAGPFEDRVVGERLPVIAVDGGPQTFGHWVSAPDFSRGLLPFLDGDPVVGGTACAVLWNAEGVVDGEVIDDQGTSLSDNVAYLDCVDTWRMNNSHFGDFAAYHFAYYHELALESARRYWRTRQPACRAAAYTLEGWGQHYLTDAAAAGHAWNPAGTYDAGFDWQTTNAVTQRMRIHNALNEGGARFAGSLYDLGVMWGDHSEQHLAASVPELTETGDDLQGALVLHLSRMALGQVTALAECGGPVAGDDVFGGGDDVVDPRRVYASDDSMCGVMYGSDIGSWEPDWFEDLGVDMEDVQGVVDRCRADEGVLGAGHAGMLLARHWFQDKYYEASDIDGWVSPTVDPNSVVDPADLGCADDLPVLPLPAVSDACGMQRCDVAPDDAGACPDGLRAEAGCCLAAPADLGVAYGRVTATPWRSAPLLPLTALGNAGAIGGESSEFLWFDAEVAELAAGAPVAIEDAETATLTSAAAVAACGAQASFSVHEARVRLPRSTVLATTEIDLRILGLDDGVRVEVDGRAVRYLTHRDLDDAGGSLVVPLLGQALPPRAGGDHVVRVVQVNDCGEPRPLVVRLEARGPTDAGDPPDVDGGVEPGRDGGPGADDGSPAGGCGCQGSRGGSSAGAALAPLALLMLALAARRRRPAAR